jgi:predicted dehydrogenase
VTGPVPVGTGPVSVGIVGCGNIFRSYALGLGKLGSVRVAGCADIDQDRAQAMAKAHDLRAYDSPGHLIADPQVGLVVNITPPAAHAAVTRQALDSGKHVFVEKPLAASLADAGPVIAALASAPGRLGCAPDTFLASAGQTARAAVDAGLIGEPVGVAAAIPHSRAEEWHPDPTFLFRAGGGPLLDMGPYYVATIVNCLGPVASLAGATRIGANPRPVTAPGRLVDTVSVEVPTHAVAVLTFASGAIGTLTASFDIWSEHLPHIEIYGTEGILRVPNPDLFEGDVTVKPNGRDEWEVLPPVLSLGEFLPPDQRIRGLGVADLVDSLDGRPQRTSAELGHHVLEVLESIEASSTSGAVVQLTTAPARPARVDAGDLAGLAAAPAHV